MWIDDGSGLTITIPMVARSKGLADPRWSPDGRNLAWVETVSGRADLMVMPLAEAGNPQGVSAAGPPVAVTVDAGVARSGSAFAWTPDGATIVYAAADGRLLAVAAAGGPVRTLARDGRAGAPAVSPDGTRVAFVLERDDACEIAAVPVDGSAWPVRVSGRPVSGRPDGVGADYAIDPAWSADGTALAWHEWDFPAMPWDGSRIVLRPVAGCTPAGPPVVVAGGDGEATGQPRFSPDGSALAFVSDRTGFMNLWVASADGKQPFPVLEEPLEHAEPTWGPGQRSFVWSPDGRGLALNRNEAGFGRLVLVPADGEQPVVDLSKGWHHGLDWGPAGVTCLRSGARTPPRVTVLDPQTPGGPGRSVFAQGAPAALTAADPVEPEPVTWESDDGATVFGLLYRSAAARQGDGPPPPLFVYVHGGPTGCSAVGWTPRHQFWVDRGWAVLAPNYRGSTGYGRAYTQALTGQWGVCDVADVAAGIRHAGRAGWGDPARVAIDGGSAGGFTLLLVCAQHPDLVRAGVDRYGVADLFDLAATTHRYESRYLDQVVGPLPESADRYHERSPLAQAGDIKTPLLVLQGDKDDTVPQAQADALVEALKRNGTSVEYHVYAGEGHGWSKPETMTDELERAERFLNRWVLGRVTP